MGRLKSKELKNKRAKQAKQSARKYKVVKKRLKTRKVSSRKIRKVVKKPNEKVLVNKKEYVEKLESEILNSIDLVEKEEKGEVERDDRFVSQQILFRLPLVTEPLVGSPKQVQEELDTLALQMQKRPSNDKIFDKIHLYIHGYLVNVALRKFPYIKGLQTVDIYQETLIALRFKAIPHFKRGKGMSFLNFAKMCIRRHLITLLNTSKTRLKDQTINRAISLDSSPLQDDENNGQNTYFNVIADGALAVDKMAENSEAFTMTKKSLYVALSDFEQVVLEEYLASSSYREISKNVSKKLKKKCNTKSIDNALLRIRKKAIYLRKHGKFEDVPLFIL